DFNPAGMSQEEIERLKLEDGVRLHESVKVELETYARETGNAIVKPFLLVIARDTTHAGQLIELVKSDGFFGGHYNDKVIQVDSSRTGAEEEAMIERLLKVEHTDEPTEIVIHVNMLKEGWDVTNLYTIVPLRAANARTLIEQSIGRGLRLPYGRRTGVTPVDRLNIIAHDKFQEIVDEANRPDSTIRLQQVIIDPESIGRTPRTVVSQPLLASQLGLAPTQATSSTVLAGQATSSSVFHTDAEKEVARIAVDVIRKMEAQPGTVPSIAALSTSEVRAKVLEQVRAEYRPQQMELEGVFTPPDMSAVVNKTLDLVVGQTISIPRILVVPKGEVRSGFRAFPLDLQALNYQPPSEDLWVQFLRTGATEIVGLTSKRGIEEKRLEDYVVGGLMDFNDVSYDDHADLLYDLSGQVVRHFMSRLSEVDTRKVLRLHQRAIANFVHAQMQDHYWEEAVDYEVVVSKGFTALKDSAYTAMDSALDFRFSPADKTNMAKYLFNGFSRCLYPVQKFDSDTERLLAVILDRDAEKWFRPAKG
ncbi:MAG: type III restriction endonuclease subunit R, partial [Burkholderiales bacterium]